MTFSRRQIAVLLVCVGIFALGQFHRASGSVFTPVLMDRYALSAATVAGLVSAMFIATLSAQIPFGAALDRFGPRYILSGCILFVAVGTAVFALENAFETALVARVTIGLGLASMGAASHVIIARNFAARDFGFISGLVVTLGGVGGLLGTYPLAVALGLWSWDAVFSAAALFAVILSLTVFWVLAPQQNSAETEAIAAIEVGQGGRFLDLIRQREFLKILALGPVTFAPITTVTGLWGGPFFQDVVGLSSEGAGFVMLLLFGATLSAGFVYGVLDRRMQSRRRLTLTGVVISVLSIFALAATSDPSVEVALGLLLVMCFCQQFYIPLGAHMRRITPDHLLARASTLLTFVSVLGIPVMQFGFGLVIDMAAAQGLVLADQYRLAFGTMAIVIALGGCVYATAESVNNSNEASVE
ncbi:MAG: MFS transporter [Pikeienuella sp.]